MLKFFSAIQSGYQALAGYSKTAAKVVVGTGAVAGGATAVNLATSGQGQSWLSRAWNAIATEAGVAGADADQKAKFAGFYSMIQQFGELIENIFGKGGIGTILRDWGLKAQGKNPETEVRAELKEVASIPDNGTSVASLGLGATAGMGVAATTKLGIATGLKAVPVAGTVMAGTETLSDAWGHASRGEYGNAVTRLVGGGLESLSYLGGAFTGAAGNAANEAVRKGAIAIGLADETVAKSTVRQVGEYGYDMATGPGGMN